MNKIHVIITSRTDFEVVDIKNATQINLDSATHKKWVVYAGQTAVGNYDVDKYDCHVIGVLEDIA